MSTNHDVVRDRDEEDELLFPQLEPPGAHDAQGAEQLEGVKERDVVLPDLDPPVEVPGRPVIPTQVVPDRTVPLGDRGPALQAAPAPTAVPAATPSVAAVSPQPGQSVAFARPAAPAAAGRGVRRSDEHVDDLIRSRRELLAGRTCQLAGVVPAGASYAVEPEGHVAREWHICPACFPDE